MFGANESMNSRIIGLISLWVIYYAKYASVHNHYILDKTVAQIRSMWYRFAFRYHVDLIRKFENTDSEISSICISVFWPNWAVDSCSRF